jgi:hypothetical protein
MKGSLGVLLLAAAACSSPPKGTPIPPPAIRVTTNHGVFLIDFSDLRMNPNGSTPVWALFTFIKDDPVAGRVEWTKYQIEGERLGISEESEGSSFFHQVFSQKLGRIVFVNFETGLRIKSISPGKESEPTFKTCRLPVWPASPQCPGPVEAKSRMDEVILENASGRLQVHRKPSPPSADEGLCREHGGTREPRPWTDEQARARRDLEARGWLWRADQEWQSKNPKVRLRAQDTYKMLMKDYPREEPVVRNLDRIKSRSLADVDE